MGKTIAQALIDKGRQEGRSEGKIEGVIEGGRSLLLFQLRKKFKKVPERIVAEIEATTDFQQLKTWLAAILTARHITDMPFNSQP